MKKMIFRLGLMGIALLGAFLVNPPKAEAVQCKLKYIHKGGGSAVYDCGEYGEVTVLKTVVVK